MLTNRNRINIAMLLVLAFVFAGCSTTGKPMTHKQQGIIWMSTYNSVYDDTLATMKSSTATAEQKALALKKKDVLTKAWPLLTAYMEIVDKGGTPTDERVAAITELINQLTALAGGV
jgi:thiamine biosynthesis lipoprotein ApbE